LTRKQAQTQRRLEEANDKLNDALERVDGLTESVSRSQAQAAAAAEAARQAELDAQAARAYQDDKRERGIVRAVPYRPYDPYRKHYKDRNHNHGKHKFKNRHSKHRKHDKIFTLPYGKKKSRIEKHKTQRRNPFQYHIPKPILPPEKHRIPRAYGIR